MDEVNYIRVDEEDDAIRVYDCQGKVYAEFDDGPRYQRRQEAEDYALKQSLRLGCDWGTNYN
jgi:hypothetical protein